MSFIMKKTSRRNQSLSPGDVSVCIPVGTRQHVQVKWLITMQLFFAMVILAELGHVRNVNKAREGIECHQNNALMLTFQQSLKLFIRISIRRVLFFYCSDKCDTVSVTVALLDVHFGLISTFLKLAKKSQFCLWTLVQFKEFFNQIDHSHYSGFNLKIHLQFTFKNWIKRNEMQYNVKHKTTILILTSFIFQARVLKFTEIK